ncbi:MAG: type II toxin-antitoxin system HicB family antitoxin [Candidatus Aminicenantes bacterium]|nr:type II toxin-antitoxin system HicB family antitoxin [Candidatus Aminicenantes bacterium]NLH76191.1 type II toxin-antitoxin system HicB family antitoxin [Acidobacteriota bacterium]
MKHSDKYLKIVEWSDEDGCYVGSIPGWIGPCCHGDNEIRVYQDLCAVLGEWIKIYRKDGRPLPPPTAKSYSGKFVLRTGPDLHQALSVRAMLEGESLNTYVVRSLRKSVGG